MYNGRPFHNQVIQMYVFFKKYIFDCSLIFIIVAFRFWLGKDQILMANGGSIFDDQLFVENAATILQGQWLGSYTDFTLLKGIFYPLWIAAMYSIRIPLLLSQQYLYICSSIIFYIALRMRYKRIWSLIPFVFVLYDPVFYQISEQVIRYHIYTSLTILVVSGLLIHNYVKTRLSFHKYLISSFVIGVVCALMYLTKEEFFWIVPVISGSLLFTSFGAQTVQVTFRQIKNIRFNGMGLGVFVFGMMIVLVSISYLNYQRYRIFAINDIKQTPFILVYGDLLRITHKTHNRYVTIPNETIGIAASVSPSFAKLEPIIHGADTQWARDQTNSYVLPSVTNEIGANEFILVLRQAARELGYFQNAETTSDFFRTIHRDISQACETRKIECYPWNLRILSPVRQEEYGLILESLLHSFATLFYFYEIDTKISPSIGATEDMIFIQRMTRSRLVADHVDTSYKEYGLQRRETKSDVTLYMKYLLNIYTVITVWIVMIGIGSYVVLLLVSLIRREIDFLFIFLSSLLVSMSCLVFFISYIAAIQTPLPKIIYMAPVSPLLYIFSCIAFIHVIGNIKKYGISHLHVYRYHRKKL